MSNHTQDVSESVIIFDNEEIFDSISFQFEKLEDIGKLFEVFDVLSNSQVFAQSPQVIPTFSSSC